jgi:hypothetical protein
LISTVAGLCDLGAKELGLLPKSTDYVPQHVEYSLSGQEAQTITCQKLSDSNVSCGAIEYKLVQEPKSNEN